MIHIRKFNRTSRDTQERFWSGYFIALVTAVPIAFLAGALVERFG